MDFFRDQYSPFPYHQEVIHTLKYIYSNNNINLYKYLYERVLNLFRWFRRYIKYSNIR